MTLSKKKSKKRGKKEKKNNDNKYDHDNSNLAPFVYNENGKDNSQYWAKADQNAGCRFAIKITSCPLPIKNRVRRRKSINTINTQKEKFEKAFHQKANIIPDIAISLLEFVHNTLQ